MDVERFERVVSRRPERWKARVFSDGEWARAEARADTMAVLAARFAAKEAVFKVLGTGWGQGVAWKDVEVVGGGRTAPSLALYGKARELAQARGLTMALSISHAGDMASAVVIGYPS